MSTQTHREAQIHTKAGIHRLTQICTHTHTQTHTDTQELADAKQHRHGQEQSASPCFSAELRQHWTGPGAALGGHGTCHHAQSSTGGSHLEPGHCPHVSKATVHLVSRSASGRRADEQVGGRPVCRPLGQAEPSSEPGARSSGGPEGISTMRQQAAVLRTSFLGSPEKHEQILHLGLRRSCIWDCKTTWSQQLHLCHPGSHATFSSP